MWWLAVGAVLVSLGVVTALRAARNAADERATTAGGLALALGLSVAFWGLVAVVVGLVGLLR